METLQPLLNLLLGDSGRVAQVVAMVGALRLALKPFNLWLQSRLTAMISAAQGDAPESASRDRLMALLDSSAYQVFAFLADLLTSVKLPDANALIQHRAALPQTPDARPQTLP